MAYSYSPPFTPGLSEGREGDFLQDPALWRDRLPQPYRMIDETLQELLMMVFDQLELRTLDKERQRLNRKIPSVNEASLMMSLPESDRIAVSSTDSVEYIVAAGSLGVHVLRLNSAATDDRQSNAASISCSGRVTAISVQSRGGSVFIVLSIDNELLKILVYQNDNIYDICQIDGVNAEDVQLSPNMSFLAVTLAPPASSEDDPASTTAVHSSSISLYTVPVEQWMQSIESVQDQQLQQQQLFCTSPTLLYSLTPPTESPPPTSDPVQIMKQIQEKSSVTLPIGNIALTETYLQNRKQLFLSQPHRKDFVKTAINTNDDDNSLLKKRPLIEFLYYWDGSYTQTASAVAIAWTKTPSLLIYSLTNNKKGNVVSPDRVYLQANYISSMTANNDTTLICLGLESGNVSMYDIKTGLYWGVKAFSPRSPVSAIKFAPSNGESPRQPVVVVGGCADGTVHCLKWTSLSDSTHTILNSGYSSNSGVRDILFCVSNPAIFTTRHEDGLLVVWEWSSKCAPLCSLSLPSPFTPTTSSHLAAAASSIDSVFVVGTQPNTLPDQTTQLGSGVFSWNLSTCEVLRKTWINSSFRLASSSKTLLLPSATAGHEEDQMNVLMKMAEHKMRSDEEVYQDITKCWEELETLIRNNRIMNT